MRYIASFKQKGSGKLLWVSGGAETHIQAIDLMQSYVGLLNARDGKRYRLYGGPLEIKSLKK